MLHPCPSRRYCTEPTMGMFSALEYLGIECLVGIRWSPSVPSRPLYHQRSPIDDPAAVCVHPTSRSSHPQRLAQHVQMPALAWRLPKPRHMPPGWHDLRRNVVTTNHIDGRLQGTHRSTHSVKPRLRLTPGRHSDAYQIITIPKLSNGIDHACKGTGLFKLRDRGRRPSQPGLASTTPEGHPEMVQNFFLVMLSLSVSTTIDQPAGMAVWGTRTHQEYRLQ
ncbi:hypothetical protein B0I35DRAFT_3974 [Stachybotrys elegans]|uniref:Uncharacterized protein n=1 Tax=Stachybotrys elegans TaxID=80388 RepID=A0A8K0T203_9HYPO|nr:hypothetical protein B0I35DRAFT_3974 [Stachybotrys elegans]